MKHHLRLEWRRGAIWSVLTLCWVATSATPIRSARADAQQQAIASLKSAGATISGDAESGFKISMGPETTGTSFAELARISHVRWLILRGDWITDAHLKQAASFKNIELLELDAPNVGDQGLASIAGLQKVFLLSLHHLNITDESLAHLSRLPKLVNLEVSGCKRVHGEGLKYLRGLPKLFELGLKQNSLSDAGLAHLSQLEHLGRVTLQQERITDAAVYHLKALAGLKKLEELLLYDTEISAAGASAIQRALPGVQVVRADVAAGQEKLRRIGAALRKYRSQHGQFPLAVLTGPDGKTQYSWRVALLPLLGEKALFEQYRLGDRWDSRANHQVLVQMPDVYRAPEAPIGTHNAGYFAVTGPSTLFPASKAAATGNARSARDLTILIVEVERGIPWTKPEDIAYHDDQPLPDLGGLHEHGFNALPLRGEPWFAVFDFPAKSEVWDEWLRSFLSTRGDDIWKRKIAMKLTGKRAPDFTLKNLDGEDVSFSKLARGKVVLISFSAVNCGPCRVEAPRLSRLYTKLKDQGLVVITVNSWDEPADAVRKYVCDKKLSNVFLLRGRRVAQDQYLVRTYPTCCLIDHRGKIVHVDFGFSPGDEEAIEKRADELLAARRREAR
jgi:peroxiredoxin